MKQWFIFGLMCGAIIVLILSCQKDQPIPKAINYGYNYFPNVVGHYVIYNVDSIIRNTYHANADTEYKYQIKEEIDSIYQDGSGRPTQRIVRYRRFDTTKAWIIEKVWSANLTSADAERVEDNIRYVRLVFPVQLNVTWNGNAYNTIPDNDGSSYQYTSVDQPFTIGNNTFDSTLIVIEDSTQNPIEHKFYMERYARNIGRIYRKYIDLEDTASYLPLAIHPLIIEDTLMQHLKTGSVVYVENYVTSGHD